jgi:hypothetical protein
VDFTKTMIKTVVDFIKLGHGALNAGFFASHIIIFGK